MGKHILVVHTNAKEGQDEAFNEWYSNVHVQEVVQIPGFVSAQRFQLSDEQMGGECAYKYLAIYEIEAESAGAALDALKAARPQLNMTDSLDDQRVLLAFDQLTEKVTA